MTENKLKFSCPCIFGLEKTLSFEIKKIGGEDIKLSDGRVDFSGDFSTLAKANICLNTAERVLILLGEFTAKSFEELFEETRKLPLENFVGVKDDFPVKGHCLNSALHSVPDCQKIIKKAFVKRLSDCYGVNWFEQTGAKYQIQFAILKDNCRIYLDTTGTALHKRGYRAKSNDAPIKETLAAGIADLARVRPDTLLVDPMCGSGTLLIEGAYKALNIGGGIRRKFSAEQWDCIPESVWKDARNFAMANINHEGAFKAIGSDIDPKSIAIAGGNTKKAGVGSKFELSVEDVKNAVLPQECTIVCNPPYGERLLDIKSAEKLYEVMGQVFSPSSKRPCYIISPHEEFEKFFGKKADKRRKLYNGMIKCQLFMYFK